PQRRGACGTVIVCPVWRPPSGRRVDERAAPRAAAKRHGGFQGPRIMLQTRIPDQQGLYDPRHEHESCGVGFVVDLHGRKSHDIVRQALTVLNNLEHRGACGCEANTGDGAGILLQTPHAFLQNACEPLKIKLPAAGEYGVGTVFLPTDPQERRQCEGLFEKIIREEGQLALGWRTVPTRNADVGPPARAAEPANRQGVSGQPGRGTAAGLPDELAFERKLYVIRKRVENEVRRSALAQRGMFYVASLSCKTIIYKGMLNAPQVVAYFPDLQDPAVESALA